MRRGQAKATTKAPIVRPVAVDVVLSRQARADPKTAAAMTARPRWRRQLYHPSFARQAGAPIGRERVRSAGMHHARWSLDLFDEVLVGQPDPPSVETFRPASASGNDHRDFRLVGQTKHPADT